MNEAETRAEHIDPALKAAGWGVVEGSKIRREYPSTPGRIEGHGKRGKALTAEYVLVYRNRKLAVDEAKAWDKPLTEGVGQAKDCAGKMAVRFAYVTTHRLAVMNLALRGIEADFGPEHADTFRRDLHPDLRADYVLANPPFNDFDWFRKDDDVRWQFGVPPKGDANFAWVQHFIHHLAPRGMAGFVLANGSMSSNRSGEGDIRRALIEADLVDCMVALPGQLFYSRQIPVCLWFFAKNKNTDAKRGFRDGSASENSLAIAA